MTRPVAGTRALGNDLIQIDTRTAGLDRVTAAYLFATPQPTLLECGPARSIGSVLGTLAALGLEPDDLANLIVTHVHLDHAGGAGDLLAAFPRATLWVSEIGARHMVDPERLNASSRRVYGPLMDEVFGDCRPIEQHRVVAITDGDRLDLGGGRYLDLLHTPGHASHHVSAVDSGTGALFAGDSLGVRLPGMTTIRPATPPPDIDVTAGHATLARYVEIDPTDVYLAHYGAVPDVAEGLADADAQLSRWYDTARAAWSERHQLDDVIAALRQRFATAPSDGADLQRTEADRRLDLLTPFATNAAGLVRDIARRDDAPE